MIATLLLRLTPDGPWTDVESGDQSIVGLVTDRVRAVMLLNRAGRGHRVPLSEGFYVSPIPTGDVGAIVVAAAGTRGTARVAIAAASAPELNGPATGRKRRT